MITSVEELYDNIFLINKECEIYAQNVKTAMDIYRKLKGEKDTKMNKQLDPINEIKRFQKDRLLDKQEYNALNEHTNIFEELCESTGFKTIKENRELLSDKLKKFIRELINKEVILPNDYPGFDPEEGVDAYCDIIVFCVGAIQKLGYEPKKALLEVTKEINSREGEIIDGKFQKFTTEEYTNKWYKANFSKVKE